MTVGGHLSLMASPIGRDSRRVAPSIVPINLVHIYLVILTFLDFLGLFTVRAPVLFYSGLPKFFYVPNSPLVCHTLCWSTFATIDPSMISSAGSAAPVFAY